ncbi:MAG: ferritin-like domain-containing protein [Pseudomonadota bacterium]
MTRDTVVFGYLGRALSLELSAVQQYLALARLLEMRGMNEAAKQFRHEAHEEMEHAERIIARMLALGVAPSASRLRPARLDGPLPQLLQHATELENDIVSFYAQAVRYCARAEDAESRIFFEALWREEQAHAATIDTWRQESVNGPTTGET